MTTRQHHMSGSPWEEIYGYSRAVRVGEHIHVAGTTATAPSGDVVGVGDVEAQTRYIFALIERALGELGASLDDVVRTRAFITDITQHDAFGRAHKDILGHVQPAATLVEVRALISPEHLIEIEVDAWCPNETKQ